MKYLILAFFVLNVYNFSLNDDWDGMEEAVKVQQDAVLDLVDQLDLYSDIPITQQIENQVQQLMDLSEENDKVEKVDEQIEEVHSLEYWLERLGDEYQDDTILLSQQQPLENINQLNEVNEDIDKKQTYNNDDINLEDGDQNINENIQIQELLNSALQIQQKLDQDLKLQQNDQTISEENNQMEIGYDYLTEIDNLISQSNDILENAVQLQIDSINEESSIESTSKFTPNEDIINQVQENTRMYNFLNDVHDDNQNQSKQQDQETYHYKEYNFKQFDQNEHQLDNDNKDNNLQFQEDKRTYQFINKNESEQNKEKQSNLNNQETSQLKKYLLYTDQPEVISTGTTQKEIEQDRRLINAFKSMNRDEHWEKTDQKQIQNQDNRNELIRFSNVNEKSQENESQFKEVKQNKVENPHKFISFKADPQFEKLENAKKDQNVLSKYDELPETKLQSKEEMQMEKQQKIQEMQKIIEEQLKNKTFKLKSETDKSLQFESDYLQWERATQSKIYPAEINFVMTQNNLRIRH